MPFVKGKSGNPSGRPKNRLADGRTLTEVAREHTGEALEALLSVLRDDDAPHAAIISAANAIIERGWGKATQGVELTGKDGEDIKIRQVNDDADAVISRLTAGIAAAGIARAPSGTVQ